MKPPPPPGRCGVCGRVRRLLPRPARERLQRLEERLKQAVVIPKELK